MNLQNSFLVHWQFLRLEANVNDRDGLTDMTMLHYVAKAGAQGMGDVDEACRMCTLLLQVRHCNNKDKHSYLHEVTSEPVYSINFTYIFRKKNRLFTPLYCPIHVLC